MKVEPIRDKALIRRIIEALAGDRSQRGERRYLLFVSGIYLGRRVGDLLKLRVGDVRGRKYLEITEQKTGKRKLLAFNDVLQKIYIQFPWLLRATMRSPLRSPAHVEGTQGFLPQSGKDLERPSSTRLEARFPYHGSGAMTRSPSPLAWRPDFPGAPREAH